METGSVHMLALTVWLFGYRFPTRWEKLQNRAVLGIEGLYVVQTLVNRVGETVSVEGSSCGSSMVLTEDSSGLSW